MKTILENIKNRKLCIYACVRFNTDLHRKLNEVMDIISPDADKSSLMKNDLYYSYCKERNVWYGEEKPTNIPHITIQEFKLNTNEIFSDNTNKDENKTTTYISTLNGEKMYTKSQMIQCYIDAINNVGDFIQSSFSNDKKIMSAEEYLESLNKN
jgi:hypothetical protein